MSDAGDKNCEKWEWKDEDLGFALIRYCDTNPASVGSRTKVPANFIKFFRRGTKIDTTYKYKVFWSDDLTRSTPVKYLDTAASIPEFEEGEICEAIGEPGLYRAIVYTVQDSMSPLNEWESSNRVKEPAGKLCHTSFDSASTSKVRVKSLPANSSAGNTTSECSLKSLKPKKSEAGASKGKIGSLKNVSFLQNQLQIPEDANPSKNNRLKRKVHRDEPYPSDDTDDSGDASIPSPRKVKQLETLLTLSRQELRKSAIEKERLRSQINELAKLNDTDDGSLTAQGTGPEITPAAPNSSSQLRSVSPPINDRPLSSDGHLIENESCEEKTADKSDDSSDDNIGEKFHRDLLKEKKISKREIKVQERAKKRKTITSLVPIPQDFDYDAEEFVITDEFKLKKDELKTLWEIPRGEKSDAEFIKTAAVMLFGSQTLLSVGVVKGITKNGVKREGLNQTALEGIRVLLILRARREGVDVKWHTDRTKQAVVSQCTSDKIKSLRITAALALRKTTVIT